MLLTQNVTLFETVSYNYEIKCGLAQSTACTCSYAMGISFRKWQGKFDFLIYKNDAVHRGIKWKFEYSN